MNRDASPGLLGRLIRRGRRDGRRTSITLAVVAGFVALTTGIAFAFWSSTGSGTASATTGTLDAPTGTTASTTAGSGTVNVSWTAPTAGVAPAGYRVSRTATGGGSPVSVCGTGTTLVTGTSCSDTSVPDGTYTYVVTSIRGSWTAAGAPSSAVTVTSTVATTTAVASSANPAVVGQTVTYTATLTQATGATKPTGTVTFKDGSSTITCTGGNQTLSAGTATCSLSYPSTGSHSITAVYGGAGVFTGSTSSALAQVVNAASTTTGLTSSTNPSVTGQTVTFTATVAAASPGSGTPTGTVTFQDGSTTLTCTGGSQTLNGSGVATCQVPFNSASTKSIVASYAGTTNYLTSSSPSLSQNVNSASTTTTVSSSSLSSVTGQSVTYTASVAPVAPGAGAPTGSVAFKDGSNVVSGCGAQTLSGGTATCVVTPSVGSHAITAVYAGTSDFSTSTSSSITQVVSAASTSTTLSSSPNPSVTGQTVTLTATVTAVNPGTGTPTGTVSFTSDGSPITCTGGSQTLNGSGVATCGTTFNVGTKTVVATYAGSSNYLTSASGNLSQVTSKAATSTALATSKSPEKTGTTVTYTATVTATSPGAGTPSGAVTFKDGSSAISCAGGNQSLNGSGVATCTFTYSSTGSHSITAVYAGDSNYLTSTSGALTQRIVSGNVAGLAFANVKVGGNAATWNCTGNLGTSNYVCSTTSGGSGNNKVVTGDVIFVAADGTTQAVYATDLSTTLNWTSTGKTAGTGTVTVAAGASIASPGVTATMNGSNSAKVTVTFSDGLNDFTAVLQVS